LAFGFGGFYLSKIFTLPVLIALLAGVGFAATHLVFSDLESHIGIIVVIILASVDAEINTSLFF
jgi:hypothetical protein